MLSDITGVTGMAIVRDIVAGVRDPHILAAHRRSGCKASEQEIIAALTGNYRPEHLFVLRQNFEAFEFHQRQIAVARAERRLCQWTEQVSHEEAIAWVVLRRPRAARRGHGPDGRGADNNDASYVGFPHRLHDGPRALRSDSGLGRRPGPKAGEHAVGSCDRGLERFRGGGRQVDSDDACLSG